MKVKVKYRKIEEGYYTVLVARNEIGEVFYYYNCWYAITYRPMGRELPERFRTRREAAAALVNAKGK